MITVSQLQYILSVYKEGHFGRAAKECHVSQPTLSAQIHKAEEFLGFSVFDRQQKPIAVTKQGAVVVEEAQKVVAAHQRLIGLARGKFHQLAGELSLGVIPTLAPYLIPLFLKTFSDDFPLVELSIVERTTEEIVVDLKHQRLDVGLLATPLKEPRISETVIGYDPFYLYAAAGEEILDRDELRPDDLDPKKVWILEEGHCARHQMLSYCRWPKGMQPNSVRFEAGSFETLRYLIDEAGGYTIVPETFARSLPKDRRLKQIRPFEGPVPTRELGLVALEGTWKTDLIEALEKTIVSRLPRSLRSAQESQEVLPIKP